MTTGDEATKLDDTVEVQKERDRTRYEDVEAVRRHTGLAKLVEALLTAQEVARMLKVSLSMVYKLRRSGVLPSVQVGALYRFNPEVVRSFMRGELEAQRRRF